MLYLLRAHLHTATATSLDHRSQLFWCCTVTPSDCDVTGMSLGNCFVSNWEGYRSDVAVTSQSLDVNGPLLKMKWFER